MAKSGPTKGKKAPSIHSRAARRATSPGIDVDKSLKSALPPAPSVDHRPAVLAAHHSGGVAKKKKKSGRKAVLSAKAARRRERDADRAEAVMARTEEKVRRSKGRGRVLLARRKPWEDVNDQLVVAAAAAGEDKQSAGSTAKAGSRFVGEDEDMDEEEHEEDGVEQANGESARESEGAGSLAVGDIADVAMGSAEVPSTLIQEPSDEEDVIL